MGITILLGMFLAAILFVLVEAKDVCQIPQEPKDDWSKDLSQNSAWYGAPV